MSRREFLDGKVTLHGGDCRDVLATLPESSVDAIVCDPPYALTSASRKGSPRNNDPETPFGRTKLGERGFMGKTWDTGETAFATEFWVLALRALKPGGHLVAFSGTRTYHRMACAIEDAGFEIRDQLAWCYGSGFPKSHNVSKAIDAMNGADGKTSYGDYAGEWDVTVPATDDAKAWDGWGTALKPSWEPICLARKPIIGTVAQNVLTHGTGAINIDGCRVQADARPLLEHTQRSGNIYGAGLEGSRAIGLTDVGRFPANIIHDGSPEVVACFPDAGGQQADISVTAQSAKTGNIYGKMNREGEASAHLRYTENGSTNFAALPGMRRGDEGSAARFFYTAKADAHDRLGSKHPTVKPVDLMQWLCRLVCPKGGTILDPFAGTGTTGEAAWREGMKAILIEREPEYQSDIARRMELAVQPTKRTAVAKSKNGLDNPNDLPLFAGLE